MAALSLKQLDYLRNEFSREMTWTIVREVANSAFQAVEDVFESPALQNALSTAIDAATSPVVLPAAHKRAIVKQWLFSRYNRGN